MKILLDECTPHVLKRLLTGFEISTVQDLGWTGTKNGALLRLAEQHFDVFITSDQNLKHQQNLANQPRVQEAPSRIRTGEFIEIPLDDCNVT